MNEKTKIIWTKISDLRKDVGFKFALARLMFWSKGYIARVEMSKSVKLTTHAFTISKFMNIKFFIRWYHCSMSINQCFSLSIWCCRSMHVPAKINFPKIKIRWFINLTKSWNKKLKFHKIWFQILGNNSRTLYNPGAFPNLTWQQRLWNFNSSFAQPRMTLKYKVWLIFITGTFEVSFCCHCQMSSLWK